MKENYVPPKAQVFTDPNSAQMSYSLTYTSTPIQSTPANSMWRNQNINISNTFNDPNFESINQKLVGKAMPRTLVNPIIPPPIADTEYWRPTDFVVPSGINDQKTRELFQSGYAGCTESCVQVPPTCNTTPISFECNPTENGCYKVANANHYVTSQFCNKKCQVKENYENEYEENPSYPENIRNTETIPRRMPLHSKQEYNILPALPGDMINSMGYNPKQLEAHNIPSNLAVGSCQKNNAYNNYNENLFTSIIQPDVYKRNDIIEPIDSNMGISFTQQFEPVTCQLKNKGETLYTSHDPRLTSKIPPTQYEFVEEPNESNVYDPRFTGYGSNYRTYLEPMTGQIRFYYDDVDAIRRYNYITRNKLDFTDYGTSSGPMRKKEFIDTKDIRKKAQLTFTNSVINHRTDLQERLMRKINANAWQKKSAPMHTRQMLFTT